MAYTQDVRPAPQMEQIGTTTASREALTQLVNRYAQSESRASACEEIHKLDRAGRLGLIELFRAELARLRIYANLASLATFAPSAILVVLAYRHAVPGKPAGWIGLATVAVGATLSFVFLRRVSSTFRALRWAICELRGPEIVQSLLQWAIASEGPYSGLDAMRERQAALECIARNLPSVDNENYALRWLHERFLLHTACRRAKKKDIEPWEWTLVKGVRGLTHRFRDQNATAKLSAAISGGPNISRN